MCFEIIQLFPHNFGVMWSDPQKPLKIKELPKTSSHIQPQHRSKRGRRIGGRRMKKQPEIKSWINLLPYNIGLLNIYKTFHGTIYKFDSGRRKYFFFKSRIYLNWPFFILDLTFSPVIYGSEVIEGEVEILWDNLCLLHNLKKYLLFCLTNYRC